MPVKGIIQLEVVFYALFLNIENNKICISFAHIDTQIVLLHKASFPVKNESKVPGIISLVKIRCRCTMLFPDLNLAEGRICPTGSKPKAGTFSSDILTVLPIKESF